MLLLLFNTFRSVLSQSQWVHGRPTLPGVGVSLPLFSLLLLLLLLVLLLLLLSFLFFLLLALRPSFPWR